MPQQEPCAGPERHSPTVASARPREAPGRAAQRDHVGKGLSLGHASAGKAGGASRRDARPGAPDRCGNYGYAIVTAAFGGGGQPQRPANAHGAMHVGKAGNDDTASHDYRAGLTDEVRAFDAALQTPRRNMKFR
jgi:hypothetical protein